MATGKNNKRNTRKSTSKKSASAKAKRASKSVSKNIVPAYIITMLLVTVLLAVLMYVDYGGGGIINKWVKAGLCGLFGVFGYFMPVLCAGLTAYLVRTKNIDRFWLKLALSFLALINVSAIASLSVPEVSQSISEAFRVGAENAAGGGFFGAAVALFLENMVQKIAAYIILFLTLIVVASFLTHISLFSLAWEWIKGTAEDARERHAYARAEREAENYEDEIYEEAYYEESTGGRADILDAAKSLTKREDKSAKKKKQKTDKKETPAPAPEKNPLPDVFSDGIDEIFGKEEKKDEAVKLEKDNIDKKEMTASENKKEENAVTEKAVREKKDRTGKNTKQENENYADEFNRALERPTIEYTTPPLDILNMPKEISGDKREEMRRTAEKLITILRDFGVTARLVQVTQGPTVTRYEIQPDTGIKLSKIVGLADDIALNLAVNTVLVAPVPGKAAVGVEIPNKKVSAVSIREMLSSNTFKNAKSRLTVALGKDIGGNVVIGDIAKMPHVLIAGATGSGKSVCINTMIMSILYKAKPDEVKMIMVDPKRVELGVYNGIPHLLVPVVTDPKKAAGALNWAVTEMMHRYDLFNDTGVRKLESYNKLMESEGGEKLPQLVIIIDELADLMMVAAKEVEDYIVRLTQLARAAGIYLVIATQRPSVDVITGLIKANVPSRIALAVSSQVDSRTILDKAGAEKLLGNGDMLYHPAGARNAARVQGAYVSDSEIESVLEFIKEHSGETHYSEDLAEEIERHATGENGVTPDAPDEDGDPLLRDAIELAASLGKISTSMVQRRLGVGYSRAGRIIDQMEARGIISGANGSKPRELLRLPSELGVNVSPQYDDLDEE